MGPVADHRNIFGAPTTRWSACLTVLAAMEFVSAQTPPRQLPPTGPLEKYDNPPAYIFRLEASPRLISQYGSFTSYQVNVDANGNNIVGDAANEPSICADPNNPERMAIGWRQFDSIGSNFREAGWGYTTDGGVNWRFPGVLQNNVFRTDPVLNSDDVGRFFYLSLLGSFFDDLWRSLNFGQTWTRLQGQGGATGGDKQWFTIDKTNSIGHGFQYQAWSTEGNNFGGRQFSRSTDGGFSWMNPINIPNSPVWGTLDVDSNGNLFIGGVSNFSSPFWCVRSSNAKNGNVVPTFDQVTQVNLGGSLVFSQPINPEGLVGQLFLAVDRSGTATNNNIYMLASVRPTGANNGTDVMFVRSTNGGQSFSAPRRINDDPINHNKWHWFGTLAVAPNGRIDAVWLDTRNAPNNTNSQLFYSWSTDGGVTWSANVAVSNSFNPFLGYPNQNKIGDYITIVSDATGGNVAYAATFNGEQDIYFVRVAPTGETISTPNRPSGPTSGCTGTNYQYSTGGSTSNLGHSVQYRFDWGDGQVSDWLPVGVTAASHTWVSPGTYAVKAQSRCATHTNVLSAYSNVLFVTVGTCRASVADFNNDGYPDYVLRNVTTHQTVLWYLNDNVYAGSAEGPTLPVPWRLACVADFNRDIHPDYTLMNPNNRQTLIGYLSGPTVIGAAFGPTLATGWELAAAADFNNDGYPDYTLYKTSTRQTAVWYLNDNLFVGGAWGPTLPATWSLVAVADFNGDSFQDYALFNPNTGQTVIGYLSGPTLIGAAFGPTVPAGWALVAVADFNGDGHPDYLLYKASTRQTAIGYLDNNILVGAALGPTLPPGWSLVAQ
jgi:FG-GAP-like repeat